LFTAVSLSPFLEALRIKLLGNPAICRRRERRGRGLKA